MTGLLTIKSPEELDIEAAEAEEEARLAALEAEPVLTDLAHHIRTCWEAARTAKQPIEELMLRSLRQRNGEYEPSKLAEIRQVGGSEVFLKLTEIKCRAAEAWLRDIEMDSGAPPWGLKPTPIPELNDSQMEEVEMFATESITIGIQLLGRAPSQIELNEIREWGIQEYKRRLHQKAMNRAEGMQDRISDQFAEGGFTQAFNDFITDLVTYPAAIVKGPIIRRKKKLGYVGNEEEGYDVVPEEVIAPEFERVDPFRVYPEPGITEISEGYLIEHHQLSRPALAELIGVDGFHEDSIRQILEEGAGATFIESYHETEKEELESKYNVSQRPTDVYDALEYWGQLPGRWLLEWGIDEGEIDDPDREYDANVWLVGRHVIKAVLNYDPLGEKPYSKTSFIKRPGAFWGIGIPEIIADLQVVCNATARALVNNVATSSGPQVEVAVDRLPPGEAIEDIYPRKIWQSLSDPNASAAPAIRFHDPPIHTNELLKVLQDFSRLADDHSGVPPYLHGDLDTQGAGRTASGLSMLMGSAGKGIRQVIMHIDSDIIKPIVKRQFIFNMRYDDDPSIKGDLEIVPRGAINLAHRDSDMVRQLEFLRETANPIDAQILGADGRRILLHEVAKNFKFPADEVVPTRESFGMRMRAQEVMGQQQSAEGGEPPSDRQYTKTV